MTEGQAPAPDAARHAPAGTDPAVSIKGLSKSYGATAALRDVSFSVEGGHIHALIGGNGSGKSTLIKVLAGVVRADPGGQVLLGGKTIPVSRLSPALAARAGLHFVHQDPGIFPVLTVAENLAIGRGFETATAGRIAWRRQHRRAASLLARFDVAVDPAAPAAQLRPAERTMVAIARALQDQEETSSGVLLLDEPTAALSVAEVDLLLAALRRYAGRGQTIVLVSHRLDEVLAVADTVTVLRDGRHVHTGPLAGHTTASLAELIMGRMLEPPAVAQRSSLRERSEPPVLSVRDLSAGSLSGIDLDLRAGEIVGIAGLVGSGRSTLLRALFGATPARSATIAIDGRPVRLEEVATAMSAGVAYVPEDRLGDAAFTDLPLAHNLSATDVARYWKRGRLSHRRERHDAAESVREFGIAAPSIDAALSMLSGGNQQKVILARCLRRRPRILLLDEPTQGVDVGARAEIHRLIRAAVAAGACALVVSSDLEELAGLANRVVGLAGGGLAGEVSGADIKPAQLVELAYAAAGDEPVQAAR
jgi:ribose transport system ATP-binding protein